MGVLLCLIVALMSTRSTHNSDGIEPMAVTVFLPTADGRKAQMQIFPDNVRSARWEEWIIS